MSISRREIINLLTARLDEKRLQHSLGAEKEAVRLAAHHRADWQKAGLAALVHDICRCDCTQWQQNYLRTHSVRLSKEWQHDPQLWHGPCAAVYIRRELGITDREIIRAVHWHTTGCTGMTALDKVVFLADKIEPTRKYPKVRQLRKYAYDCLDKAIVLALGQTITRLSKAGQPLVKEATGAYNELLMTLKEKG